MRQAHTAMRMGTRTHVFATQSEGVFNPLTSKCSIKYYHKSLFSILGCNCPPYKKKNTLNININKTLNLSGEPINPSKTYPIIKELLTKKTNRTII